MLPKRKQVAFKKKIKGYQWKPHAPHGDKTKKKCITSSANKIITLLPNKYAKKFNAFNIAKQYLFIGLQYSCNGNTLLFFFEKNFNGLFVLLYSQILSYMTARSLNFTVL